MSRGQCQSTMSGALRQGNVPEAGKRKGKRHWTSSTYKTCKESGRTSLVPRLNYMGRKKRRRREFRSERKRAKNTSRFKRMLLRDYNTTGNEQKSKRTLSGSHKLGSQRLTKTGRIGRGPGLSFGGNNSLNLSNRFSQERIGEGFLPPALLESGKIKKDFTPEKKKNKEVGGGGRGVSRAQMEGQRGIPKNA